MKQAVSLALILELLGSTTGVSAQAGTGAGERPTKRGTQPNQFAAAERFDRTRNSSDSQSSAARQFSPGTKLIVIVQGSSPRLRFYLASDDSGMTVLNLADSKLPYLVIPVLQRTASDHPERLLQPQGTMNLGQTERGDTVRIVNGSVILNDRELAHVAGIVERIARSDLDSGVVTVKKHRLLSKGVGIAIWSGVGGAIVLLSFLADLARS